MHYESFTSSRFPSTVSPSQLQKKNTIKTCEFLLVRFTTRFGKRDLASISQKEVLDFLLSLTKNNKQATKRNRYSVLSSFYNFSINTACQLLPIPAILPSSKRYSNVHRLFKGKSLIKKQLISLFSLSTHLSQFIQSHRKYVAQVFENKYQKRFSCKINHLRKAATITFFLFIRNTFKLTAFPRCFQDILGSLPPCWLSG
ncbi:MAG: hypothetical protein GY799_06675 [Desulfobulbaceae bacterium]|nr:hypothetical protein [Desulfobulbaceae bacterium]